MARFRHSFYKYVPSWLSSRDESEQVQYSLMLLLDHAMERIRQGLLARFPTYAPEDALSLLGTDRKIIRGIGEPAAAYAARLIRWLDDHRTRGNPYALMAQLRAYLQTDCMIRTVDRSGNWFTIAADGTRSSSTGQTNWLWDATASSQWARFWVIIYPTGGSPWTIPAAWETGNTISATEEQIATVKAIIKLWRPAGTRCEWAIVCFDDTKLAPTMSPGDADFPNSDWGNWAHFEGSATRPVRLENARYWRVG